MPSIDRIDHAILRLLQEDATVAIDDIAKTVGLSVTPCWRRIHKLQDRGYISRRVTIIDPKKVNVPMTVFVSVRVPSHKASWSEQFCRIACEFPEVVELNRMSGDIDYLMRVVVPDLAGFDRFYRKLSTKIDLSDFSASFSMEQLKYTTKLPLDYLRVGRG